LRVPGQTDGIIRTVAHDGEKILTKRLINLIKNLPRLTMGCGHRAAHTNGLRSLAGELKDNLFAHAVISTCSMASSWRRLAAHTTGLDVISFVSFMCQWSVLFHIWLPRSSDEGIHCTAGEAAFIPANACMAVSFVYGARSFGRQLTGVSVPCF
jgi:hypothetical protein